MHAIAGNTPAVPWWGHIWAKSVCYVGIFTPKMYILAPEMDILAPKWKSLPFEKVQPQWQLLYLFSESARLVDSTFGLKLTPRLIRYSSEAHFQILSHPGTFANCFMNTMNSNILLVSHTLFCLCCREVLSRQIIPTVWWILDWTGLLIKL